MAKQKAKSQRKVVLSAATRERIRSYDAAAFSRHITPHFTFADNLDADSLIRKDIETLRNRARYEIRNNSYASGIVDTMANDMIGTGPRLQILSDNNDFDSRVENLFGQWCLNADIEGRMKFKEILQLAGAWQQAESGEAFILLQSAEPAKHWLRARPEVRLRLLVIEPDRVAVPMLLNVTNKIRDGIEYDEFGRPIKYYILKNHPGSARAIGNFLDYDVINAAHVIHLYKQKRPGQSRGVPWITPALPLFANLRRYTLATLEGAETAANISAALKTQVTGEIFEDEIEAMDEVEIPRNAMLTLPAGSEMQQFKPEQPTTTYKDFKHEILNEIARCINMPFNIAAANSSGYNYASGRLDWQVYYRFIRTTRCWLEDHVCDRVFYTWLKEAIMIPALKIPTMDIEKVNFKWFWPGSEHVDPLKEAKAQESRLKSMTSTLSEEYATQGKDWERQIRQKAKELDLLEELGILQSDEAKLAYLGIKTAKTGAGVSKGR